MADKISLSLPSKCKVYSGVTPESIKVRTLLGKDEKIIAQASPANYDRKLYEVLGGALEGVDAQKLTLGDMKFILLWLVINSYSKDFLVKFQCDNCFSKLQMNVDLSLMPVVELPEEFVEPYTIKLTTGEEVKVRLMRVEDELASSEMEKNGQEAWLYRFSRCVIDDKKSAVEKLLWMENLPAVDVARLRSFHDKFDHGPVMETTYTCDKCGGAGVTPVPFRPEMLFPVGETLRRTFGTTV